MTKYCLYHDDLDGKCSGAIVKKYIPEVKLFPVNYGYDFPLKNIKKEDEIYIVDFCLQPFTDMIELSHKCKVFWIDHHISAIQEYQKKQKFIKKNNFKSFVPEKLEGDNKTLKAGCYLTWDYFQGVEDPDSFTIVPDIISDISNYDIWLETEDGFAVFYYMLSQNNISPENIVFWESLFRLNKMSLEYREILEKGREIRKVLNKKSYDYVSNYGISLEWEGLKFLALNRMEANSIFYADFCKDKDYDAVMTFGIIPAKVFSFHLYSLRKEKSVLHIAKKYGGGGHQNACGFQTSKIPLSLKSQLLK